MVVPFPMELSPFEIHLSQLMVGYFDASGVPILVQFSVDREPFRRCGVADQVDHHFMTHQRAAAPVLRDVAEHSMLDLVPFAGAWRKVAHRDGEACFVGQCLERDLP